MKRSSLIFYTKEGLEKVSEAVTQIADVEGLEAHGNTIKVRWGKIDPPRRHGTRRKNRH